MNVDKITPGDSRVESKHTTLNGRKYHYLLSLPSNGDFKATVFLIHGFPDTSFGWRYQIPFLTGLGLRVVALDMMGYGQTEVPQVPPEDMSLYGFKRAADDIAALSKELHAPRIILGGHDWGGMIVYRTAQWHPELVTHVFSVCTPFMPPSAKFRSTNDIVTGPFPQFGYQLQLAGPDVEEAIESKAQIKQFLAGMYGGTGEGRDPFFRPETGVDLGILDTIGMTPLLDEQELEHYTEQFATSGLHGSLNWYRNREANFEDELRLGNKTVDQPVLFIQALHDSVLTPDMATGMEAYLSKLTRRETPASHWALWQTPDKVNAFVKEWLDAVVFGNKSTL